MNTGYQSKCVKPQYNSQCAVISGYKIDGNNTSYQFVQPPKLCVDGADPINFNCDNGADCLWHCPGYVPSITDTVAKNLRSCFGTTIYSNSSWENIKTKNDQGTALPVYPTILNDENRCVSDGGDPITNLVKDLEPTKAEYWKIYNNPASNIIKKADGTNELISRSIVKNANPNTSKYMLYDSKRTPTGAVYIPGVMKQIPGENGCMAVTPNNFKQDYCNNRGTFSQTVITGSDGKKHKIKEGTCACDSGYVGNRCQFSNAITCRGRGTVTSVGTGTNALAVNNNFVCNCQGWSGDNCEYATDWFAGTWARDGPYYFYTETRNGVDMFSSYDPYNFNVKATASRISVIDDELSKLSRTNVDGTAVWYFDTVTWQTYIRYYYIVVDDKTVLLINRNEDANAATYLGMKYALVVKNPDGKIRFYQSWLPSLGNIEENSGRFRYTASNKRSSYINLKTWGT
jgi:hypothetical protein